VAPSKPPGSITAPTHGFGDVEARTDEASSRQRLIVASVERSVRIVEQNLTR